MRRVHVSIWAALIVLAVSACGDDTAKTDKSPNAGADMSDVGTSGNDTSMTPPDSGSADMGSGGDVGPDVTINPALCGNAMLDPGEQCDDANDDDTDECNSNCTFTCGDGVVGTAEACDTGIAAGDPGACPTSCDDGDACTTDTLQGSACQARCVTGTIAACADGDGCCPTTCDATTDDDCAATCGNGVVEGTETCDGNCPASCDDSIACTADAMTGSVATCDAMCTNTAITACVDGDGCCPAACDPSTDNDCSQTCGNATVEPPETCDGNCPTSAADCDDSNVCTADSVTGNAAQCNAMCVNAPLGCIANATDGCCPAMCNANNDGDCTPICGNSVVEAGEQCDDGGTTPGDGCDATCQSEAVATAFRMSDLDLMDPHIYLRFIGCRDITNGNVPLNASPPINGLLQNAITMDEDSDGLLDLSFLAIFRPLDQTNAASGGITIAEADCTAPMSSTSCVVDPAMHTIENGTYTTDTVNDCLDVFANTTYGYTPNVNASMPPCFMSTTIDLTIDISGIQVPLTDVQIGATYVGNPATGLSNGLLRGFISEADADNITLPMSLPLIGGDPLSSVLAGGTGACANHDDRDVGPDGTTMGWWFYLNFPADQVSVTEL